MKFNIGLIILVFSSFAFGSSIEKSQELGAALTEAVKGKKHVRLKKIANYKDVKQYLKEKGCKGYKYRAYVLDGEESSRFYLVGLKGKDVLVGRHFVGDINSNAVDISSITSSTNGCINLGPKKGKIAAMFVTHLKPEPNEFHVLASNLANITLYVSTSGETWLVSEGQIKVR